MSLIERSLIRFAGNPLVQDLLGRGMRAAQHLMGIGAGTHVAESGERVVLSALTERFEPPYLVFDAGANRGQFLRLLLDALPPAGLSVHCFEPGRSAFRKLQASFGRDRRIRLNELAVGSAPGEALLHYDRPGSGMASLTRRRLDHFGIGFGGRERVRVTTIDAYCEAHGIDRIDLLKLDVEGHEFDALEGARGMFGRRAVSMVTFEFGGCNIDTRVFLQDFWYFFREAGLRLFRITPSGYLHPVEAYDESLEQFRTTNYAAVLES